MSSELVEIFLCYLHKHYDNLVVLSIGTNSKMQDSRLSGYLSD